jgi:hypothetical protein
MEIEQRSVIKFFSDDGMSGVQIIARLRYHHGDGALSQTQVDLWINELKQGRTDLNTIASPRRGYDGRLAVVIAGKQDADPRFSARKIAQSLGIAISTVC